MWQTTIDQPIGNPAKEKLKTNNEKKRFDSVCWQTQRKFEDFVVKLKNHLPLRPCPP
jgi:hypothetical protein